jgi:putative transposase
MTDYRRFYIPGATWFFTVNLAQRKHNHLLVEQINLLRQSFRYVKQRKPFEINAIVVLPDHLHCILTMPSDDVDYSVRWGLLKAHFSRAMPEGERISNSRQQRRERGIWQRRFWAHLITSQDDMNNHIDYIHWNPVKHGYVNQVSDWKYSSFQRFVEGDIYPVHWGHTGQFDIDVRE